MPQMPPSIDVVDDSTMKALADSIRAATIQTSDFIATTAIHLHPLIVNTMQKYGLDGTNRFGYGSDANKAAKEVTNLMKKSAEHLVDAGQCMGFAYLAFMTKVWEPIQRAKAEQVSRKSQTLNV